MAVKQLDIQEKTQNILERQRYSRFATRLTAFWFPSVIVFILVTSLFKITVAPYLHWLLGMLSLIVCRPLIIAMRYFFAK